MSYKEELKEDMVELFNQYYGEEQGNKLTSFNMNGLVSRVTQIFDKNKIKENESESKS